MIPHALYPAISLSGRSEESASPRNIFSNLSLKNVYPSPVHAPKHTQMTSGGTESILLACKAWRDYAREHKGITRPEIVIPVTAHSAFDKAAQYLRIRVRTVPVNPNSYTVSIADMRRAITRNTIMVSNEVYTVFGVVDGFWSRFLEIKLHI